MTLKKDFDNRGWNKYNVGGDSIHVSNIAENLEHLLRSHYPMNKVPNEVVGAYYIVKHALVNAERELINFITDVIEKC